MKSWCKSWLNMTKLLYVIERKELVSGYFIELCKWLVAVTDHFCSSRYIERFRHGRPQSRKERQLRASAIGEEQEPFWWMSPSYLPPSSTPTKTTHKGIYSLAVIDSPALGRKQPFWWNPYMDSLSLSRCHPFPERWPWTWHLQSSCTASTWQSPFPMHRVP